MRNLLYRMLLLPVILGISSLFPGIDIAGFGPVLGMGWLLALACYIMDQSGLKIWLHDWLGPGVLALSAVIMLQLYALWLPKMNAAWPGTAIMGILLGMMEFLGRRLLRLHPFVQDV